MQGPQFFVVSITNSFHVIFSFVEVPDIAAIVTFCKEKVINASYELKSILRRNERLRNSISSVFVTIMRFELRSLELALKPGLSTITWTSERLQDFVAEAQIVNIFIFSVYKIHINKYLSTGHAKYRKLLRIG